MPDHKIGAADSFLKNGEMKRLDLDGTAVLVARNDDQYYAIGATCSHYGAPLDEGLLKGTTVMCPWHHACFDIRSGTRLEPPALNDVPHYAVRVENSEVVITLPNTNEVEPQGKAEPHDTRTFVIVGGGSAGNAAAEELRRQGFKGRIVMFSSVPTLPIDRPNLSKDYLAGKADPAWIPLRGDMSWYSLRGIELHLSTSIVKVDPKAVTVTTDKGVAFNYDKLLLATGGTPRRLSNVPGDDLKGIYILRTVAHADAIIEAASKAKTAVVIGSSFIGLEVAASLTARGVAVTVVDIASLPYERLFGEAVGRMFQKEHEDNGVKFALSNEISRFVGQDEHVTGVELKNGQTLPADFVVAGVGVRPATDFLTDSGLKLDDKDRSVHVDVNLQTNEPNIYAAGDIARYGDDSGTRIEHWRVAEQHGIVAARNMLGRPETVTPHIPFFWTNQFGIIFDYVGHAEKWDEIIYRGSTEKKDFIAFYVTGGKLHAAAGCNHDRELDALEFILRDNISLTPAQMRDESFDLAAHAQTGK